MALTPMEVSVNVNLVRANSQTFTAAETSNFPERVKRLSGFSPPSTPSGSGW